MENPNLLYGYEYIILRVPVKTSGGDYEKMWTVSPLTWSGFRE